MAISLLDAPISNGNSLAGGYSTVRLKLPTRTTTDGGARAPFRMFRLLFPSSLGIRVADARRVLNILS